MLIPYHLPLEMYLVSPAKAATTTRPMSEWLLGHARMLEIVVGLALGLIYLWKGLGVLIGWHAQHNAASAPEALPRLLSGACSWSTSDGET